jgi:hypothetical protein
MKKNKKYIIRFLLNKLILQKIHYFQVDTAIARGDQVGDTATLEEDGQVGARVEVLHVVGDLDEALQNGLFSIF